MKCLPSIILVILLAITGCEPAWEEPYKVYKIKKGTHAPALPKISSLQSETLLFSAIFDETAIYENTTPENQHDINKLLGFSDCNSLHHDNSARFGWRWFEDKLEVHAYCYIDGARITAFLGTVELNEKVDYLLHVSNTHFEFKLADQTPLTISRGDVCQVGVYYMLYPYFGGDEVAPHDIVIQIRQKF